MLPHILNLDDPALYKAHIFAILYGQSGSGKTRLALTFPDPLIVDCDDTISRFAQKATGRVIAVTDERMLCELADEITAGMITCGTLVIDGFARMIAQMDTTLPANKDLYWRQRTERTELLVKKLRTLPCHVVLTTRPQAINAKPGEIVGGYMVSPGEKIPVGVMPAGIPQGFADSADIVLSLTTTPTGWNAVVMKSLLDECPNHITYDDPLAEVPTSIAAATTRLIEHAPKPPVKLVAVADTVPTEPINQTTVTPVEVEPSDRISIPTNAELKALIRDRNLLVAENEAYVNLSTFLQDKLQWDRAMPIADDLRLQAASLLIAEQEAIRSNRGASDIPPSTVDVAPDNATASVEPQPPDEPALTEAVPNVATAEPIDLLAYANETIPGKPVPSVATPDTNPPSDADLLLLLRQRNAVAIKRITTVPAYMHDICDLEHVIRAADIRLSDRHVMAARIHAELDAAENAEVSNNELVGAAGLT